MIGVNIFRVTSRFLYNMKAMGRTSINNIRIQELERNTDSLSIGTNSPATGSLPLSVGPDLMFKACILLDFITVT
jgi:hypothetical protein